MWFQLDTASLDAAQALCIALPAAGLPGDSGSGVTIQDDRSAGNFTHIIINDPDLFYTPGQLTGMRTTAILTFLGSQFSQVNADGTTSTSGAAPCPSSLDGAKATSGGGKGGSGGSKGKRPKKS